MTCITGVVWGVFKQSVCSVYHVGMTSGNGNAYHTAHNPLFCLLRVSLPLKPPCKHLHKMYHGERVDVHDRLGTGLSEAAAVLC